MYAIAISGRHGTRSDSAVASYHEAIARDGSPAPPSQVQNPSPLKEAIQTPISRSPSPSRPHSPLRLFAWGIHRSQSRDEPFIPVNPFSSRPRWFRSPSSTPRRPFQDLDLECDDTIRTCLPLPIQCTGLQPQIRTWTSNIAFFLMDTLPRQLYLHALLKLPALYFSRVARIFEDAELSKHEIHRMVQMCIPPENSDNADSGQRGASGTASPIPAAARTDATLPFPDEWVSPAVSPALVRFKHSWEMFVDSLLREWKTLNLVSALLCT